MWKVSDRPLGLPGWAQPLKQVCRVGLVRGEVPSVSQALCPRVPYGLRVHAKV